MHDIADLESRGVPGGFIASTEFIDAAKAQSQAMGFDAASVFVQHPIQDRTPEEIEILADEAYEKIIGMVSAS